jgi:hypothetical protein
MLEGAFFRAGKVLLLTEDISATIDPVFMLAHWRIKAGVCLTGTQIIARSASRTHSATVFALATPALNGLTSYATTS